MIVHFCVNASLEKRNGVVHLHRWNFRKTGMVCIPGADGACVLRG